MASVPSRWPPVNEASLRVCSASASVICHQMKRSECKHLKVAAVRSASACAVRSMIRTLAFCHLRLSMVVQIVFLRSVSLQENHVRHHSPQLCTYRMCGFQHTEDAVAAEGGQHDGVAGEQTPPGQVARREQACASREAGTERSLDGPASSKDGPRPKRCDVPDCSLRVSIT